MQVNFKYDKRLEIQTCGNHNLYMKTNKELVDYLIRLGVLKTHSVIEAFLKADRADFVRGDYISEAYENYPLPIGYGQTISQPYTVAFMLELLQPKDYNSVLDVGCGSGWTTALLSFLVKNGSVIGTEIIDDLVEFGRNNIEKYKPYNAKIIKADKTPDKNAKFDRILVSAAADKIPQILLNSLKSDASMVIPIGSSIFLIEKKKGIIYTREYYGFSFVELK